MQLAVVGLGYVGLVTATCLARLGQDVIGLEVDDAKLAALSRGEAPYYEPGLQPELAQQQRDGKLRFTLDPTEAFTGADVILICVGTPSAANGEADLRAVEAVIDTIGRHLAAPSVIALRSTVPVGTTRWAEQRLDLLLDERGVGWRVPVFANPEFLRTGRAMEDFLHPSRVVIGAAANATDDDIERLSTLYRPLEAPLLVADAESAELTKNAANAYLATRVSFINELAALCEATGASVDDVIRGIAADPRIGGDYLRPGIGYGGSCLPKDVRSMMAMGRQRGLELLLATAVDAVNQAQPQRAVARLRDALGGTLSGQRIAVLGLAFKAGTDDIRDSPALSLADELRAGGAEVVACDPKAGAAARLERPWLDLRDDPLATAAGADAVVVATDWPEYVTMDFGVLGDAMRGRVLFDARNALDPARVSDAGLEYMASGRPDRPLPAS